MFSRRTPKRRPRTSAGLARDPGPLLV